ncbi:MFS transporter [Carboxydochorda subterranea]|uniref:MFS transporter n=1 Tax=Carboxydichorda subterranea TaxID=3109565 RepID=A0ABZ1C1U3_9FIRM|nr:MFS transporter [Limnochorda sp. L945t]WRP18766.1 MFS transporter [Limnochorda sp. L945t]
MALATLPLLNRLSRRLGTRRTFQLGMLLVAVAALLFFPAHLFAVAPALVRGAIVMAVAGFGFGALLTLPNVMVAEIARDDAARTGEQREGMYFAVQGVINQAVIALSGLVLGLLLEYLGDTADRPLGVQLVSPVAALIALVGASLLNRYPLGEPARESREAPSP